MMRDAPTNVGRPNAIVLSGLSKPFGMLGGGRWALSAGGNEKNFEQRKSKEYAPVVKVATLILITIIVCFEKMTVTINSAKAVCYTSL